MLRTSLSVSSGVLIRATDLDGAIDGVFDAGMRDRTLALRRYLGGLRKAAGYPQSLVSSVCWPRVGGGPRTGNRSPSTSRGEASIFSVPMAG